MNYSKYVPLIFGSFLGIMLWPSFLISAPPRRLTTDGRYKCDPVFIDKGAAIVFTVQETPTQLALVRFRLDDRSMERVNPAATTSEFEATYTPDESQLAFVQNRGNLNLKMVIRDLRNGKESIFDPGGGFASLRRPCFAPDGKRIYFSLPTSNGNEIVAVDNNGGNRITLARSGFNKDPAVSPDSKKIAFVSSRDGEYDLYTMDREGGSLKRILKAPGLEARPAWSPDGRKIAFTANRAGNYDIFIVNEDGSGLCQLTHNQERDDYAAWHPLGKQLVVVSEKAGRYDLWLYDIAP